MMLASAETAQNVMWELDEQLDDERLTHSINDRTLSGSELGWVTRPCCTIVVGHCCGDKRDLSWGALASQTSCNQEAAASVR